MGGHESTMENRRDIEQTTIRVPREASEKTVLQSPGDTVLEEHVPRVSPGETVLEERVPGVLPGETVLEERVPRVSPEETVLEDHVPRVSPGETVLEEHIPRVSPGETVLEERVPGALPGETVLEERVPGALPGETVLEERVPRVSPGETVLEDHVPRVSPGETVLEDHVPRVSPGETVLEERVPRVSPGETVLEDHVPRVSPGETQLKEHVPRALPGATMVEETVPRVAPGKAVRETELDECVARVPPGYTVLEECIPRVPPAETVSMEHVPRVSTYNYTVGQNNGTLDSSILNKKILKTKEIFAKTESFTRVERILKEESHVTLTGASGEGKTSLALMLGVEYQKLGYDLVFVTDVDRFRFEYHLGQDRKIFLIFDDIFGTKERSTDVPRLKRILLDVQLYIKESNSESKNRTSSTIRSVFTIKIHNLDCGMEKLKVQKYFSVIDITSMKQYKYSDEDKEKIFEKHKLKHGSKVDFKDVYDNGETMLGFPLMCELFFEFNALQANPKAFFKEPLFCLRQELERLLTQKDEMSVAIILILLCDDKINLAQVENEMKNTPYERLFVVLKSNILKVTGTGTAEAARNLRGIFCTTEGIIEFSHSTIYDASASVLFKNSPKFVLKNCSMKFFYERIKARPVDAVSVSDNLNVIYVSEAHFDNIAQRLARAVEEGNYSMSVTHPILMKEEVVNRMFELLNLQKTNIFDRLIDTNRNKRQKMLHLKDQGKHLLYWAVHSHSLYLVQKVLEVGYDFSVIEISDAFEACASCGNITIMKILMSSYAIPKPSIHHAVKTATENGNLDQVEYLFEYCGNVTSSEWEGVTFLFLIACERERSRRTMQSVSNSLLHDACASNDMEMVKFLLHICDVNKKLNGMTPVQRAALHGQQEVFDLLVSKKADLTLTSSNGNSVLHYACEGGNSYIVHQLLPLFDINVRRQEGATPVMHAALRGDKYMFDLLVSKGADLTVTVNKSDNTFHFAARGGNDYIVDELLSLFDINIRGQNDFTPVMHAADTGHKDVFDLLVSKGADLTLKTNKGDNMLHLASMGGNTYIVDQLLPLFDINVRGQDGWTPVMGAAQNSQKDVFDLLVSKGANLTLSDNDGFNILHYACCWSNCYIVDQLLPLFDINGKCQCGLTPVMHAARNGQKDVFDLLVSQGADLTLTSKHGNNILHLASKGGDAYIVDQLLPLFDINIRGQYGRTPVMEAAYKGQKDVFELLVSKGADLTLVNKGDNMLHHASMGGNTYIVDQLLPLFDINVRDKGGLTPVLWAATKGQKDVFDLLVSKGANLTLTSNKGDNILHFASEGGDAYIVEQLLPLFDINVRLHNGCTSVMRTALIGNKYVFDLLLSKGADLTLTSNGGNNVLHFACMGGNTYIVDQVLPLFDINVRRQNGFTPVMWAAKRGQKDAFELLVPKEADLTLTSKNGNNILHLASMGGSTFIVNQLLPLFDINVRGQVGCTPVMLAANTGQKDVFELLVSKGADLTLTDINGENVLYYARESGNDYIVD